MLIFCVSYFSPPELFLRVGVTSWSFNCCLDQNSALFAQLHAPDLFLLNFLCSYSDSSLCFAIPGYSRTPLIWIW